MYKCISDLLSEDNEDSSSIIDSSIINDNPRFVNLLYIIIMLIKMR